MYLIFFFKKKNIIILFIFIFLYTNKVGKAKKKKFQQIKNQPSNLNGKLFKIKEYIISDSTIGFLLRKRLVHFFGLRIQTFSIYATTKLLFNKNLECPHPDFVH